MSIVSDATQLCSDPVVVSVAVLVRPVDDRAARQTLPRLRLHFALFPSAHLLSLQSGIPHFPLVVDNSGRNYIYIFNIKFNDTN